MEQKTQQNKWNIDFKSLVIGFMIGLFVILVSGYSKIENKGPFECSADSGFVYILDTKTGHTWKVGDSTTVDYGTPQDRKSQQSYITPKG